MKRAVIISAGGKGLRMGAALPKQFIELNGQAILQHTIDRFRQFDPKIYIVVVLPMDQIKAWKDICEDKGHEIDYDIAVGGKERFHSIKNGLKFCFSQDLIAIHDGVRPFVSIETIEDAFESAAKNGSGVPVMPIQESIRQIKGGKSIHVARDEYRIVQTPQCFQGDILRKSYQTDYNPLFTDDASVVEASGHAIHLVEGNPENIKLTTQKDLALAQFYL